MERTVLTVILLLLLFGCAGTDGRLYGDLHPHVDLYDYVQGTTSGYGIVQDRNEMQTRQVVVNISRTVDAAETVMARQHSLAAVDPLRPEIDRLYLAYRDVEPGDRYSLCYNAGSVVATMTLNDLQLVTVELPQFAEMYSGIWLGKKNPIDTQLRGGLLPGQQ